jgi:molybdate transport system substrate-binding protein
MGGQMQTRNISGISSMATRQVLAELAAAYRTQSDAGLAAHVAFESVGGVDAAARVGAGEPFDVVVLAADAIDKLIAAGHVLADSRTDLMRSAVAIAVRAGCRRPDVATEAALRRAVLSAPSIGYSTGPSGVALLKLFERWGIADTVRGRIVQATPGIPVVRLVASGEVELGFQQYSELLNQPGIEPPATMPSGCEIFTTFSGGVCAACVRPEAARALLAFMQSPAAADAKRRQGMEPAPGLSGAAQ